MRSIMDELIGRLVSNVASTSCRGKKPSALILQFLVKRTGDQVKALLGNCRDADKTIATARADTGGMGLFGGGVIATGTRMMGLGLSMVRSRALHARP